MSSEQFLKTNFNQNQNNGRVDLLSKDSCALPIFLQDKIPINNNSFYNSLNGIQESSTLSNTFFSRENIKIIQNAIRKGVYDRTNNKYVIPEQNYDVLNIIMRSIFLQYSCNLENNIKKQIINLNNLVINYSVNQIYGELIGYLKYKNDISTLALPLSLPVCANKTTNTLELKPWF